MSCSFYQQIGTRRALFYCCCLLRFLFTKPFWQPPNSYGSTMTVTLSPKEINQFIQCSSVLMVHSGECEERNENLFLWRIHRLDICWEHVSLCLHICYSNKIRQFKSFACIYTYLHVCGGNMLWVWAVKQHTALLNPCLGASTADTGRLLPLGAVISNTFDLLHARSELLYQLFALFKNASLSVVSEHWACCFMPALRLCL